MPNSQERTLSPLERELLAALREQDRLLSVYHDQMLSPSDRVMARGTIINAIRAKGREAIAKAEAIAKPDLDGAETP